LTENKSIYGCGHPPKWLVTYDIGRNKTEQLFVCDDCFENPDDDCFRLFVVSKDDVEREVVQLD